MGPIGFAVVRPVPAEVYRFYVVVLSRPQINYTRSLPRSWPTVIKVTGDQLIVKAWLRRPADKQGRTDNEDQQSHG